MRPWLSRRDQDEAIAAGAAAGLAAARLGQSAAAPNEQARQLQARVFGPGSERADARPMVAGDDPRHIDWRLSARAGAGQRGHLAPWVRQFYPEYGATHAVLLDARAPMWFASAGDLKLSRALRACLYLAAFWDAQGQPLGLLCLHEQSAPEPSWWIAPQAAGNASGQSRSATLEALVELASSPASLPASPANDGAAETGLSRACQPLLSGLPANAQLQIWSEPLGLSDKRASNTLAQRFQLSISALLDPLDRQLPQAGRLQLASLGAWDSASPSVRQAYSARRKRALEALQQQYRALGVDWCWWDTRNLEWPPAHRPFTKALDAIDAEQAHES